MKLHLVLAVLWLGAAQVKGTGFNDLTSDELFKLLEEKTETTTQNVDARPEAFQACGYRVNGYGPRSNMKVATIINHAGYGEYPWTVAVFNKKTGSYKCVGSLIHPSVVLTVGHRFSQEPQGSSWLIKAGIWRLNDTNEQFAHQERDVGEVVVHPQIASRSLIKNNIALLFLSQPVTVNNHIGFICLPVARASTPPGSNCIATGWGQDKFVNGRLQNDMKIVEVPIVERQECQSRLRTHEKMFMLHSTMLCAGGKVGFDACIGDGGAPLVCPYQREVDDEYRYYQAGIVAAGVNCGLNVPGLYTDVASLRDWIDNHVLQRGYKTDTYTA